VAFQVGSTCYGSASAAASAASSVQAGAVVPLGSSLYVVEVAAVSDTSITYRFQDVASAATITKVSSFTPAPCGLLDAADGLAVGWAIAAVWLATAGVLFLRKGIHS
jgi:hypothetical protein